MLANLITELLGKKGFVTMKILSDSSTEIVNRLASYNNIIFVFSDGDILPNLNLAVAKVIEYITKNGYNYIDVYYDNDEFIEVTYKEDFYIQYGAWQPKIVYSSPVIDQGISRKRGRDE
jgi:hypothetical protein